MSNPFLSIIIPAYNEEKRLPETLALVRDWIERQDFEVEIIVVDDGSKDKTVTVAREFKQRFDNLRVITNAQNKGKGGVVAQGMLAATGAWRLFTDADSSTPIGEVSKLLKHIDKYEVIIGSRYLNPLSVKIKQPLRRRIISRVWNMLIQSSLLPGIRDTQCGFKLFSAKATEMVFPRQSVQGWLFDVELLTIARNQGYSIKEVAVEWYDSRESKMRALHQGKQALTELRRIKRQVRQGAYALEK